MLRLLYRLGLTSSLRERLRDSGFFTSDVVNDLCEVFVDYEKEGFRSPGYSVDKLVFSLFDYMHSRLSGTRYGHGGGTSNAANVGQVSSGGDGDGLSAPVDGARVSAEDADGLHHGFDASDAEHSVPLGNNDGISATEIIEQECTEEVTGGQNLSGPTEILPSGNSSAQGNPSGADNVTRDAIEVVPSNNCSSKVSKKRKRDTVVNLSSSPDSVGSRVRRGVHARRGKSPLSHRVDDGQSTEANPIVLGEGVLSPRRGRRKRRTDGADSTGTGTSRESLKANAKDESSAHVVNQSGTSNGVVQFGRSCAAPEEINYVVQGETIFNFLYTDGSQGWVFVDPKSCAANCALNEADRVEHGGDGGRSANRGVNESEQQIVGNDYLRMVSVPWTDYSSTAQASVAKPIAALIPDGVHSIGDASGSVYCRF